MKTTTPMKSVPSMKRSSGASKVTYGKRNIVATPARQTPKRKA
jgi:hypothetical protein